MHGKCIKKSTSQTSQLQVPYLVQNKLLLLMLLGARFDDTRIERVVAKRKKSFFFSITSSTQT